MRINFLPAEQEKRNDKTVEKLRRIGYVLFVLLMATLVLGAKLYIWPPAAQAGPQLTSDDGRTVYSDAIVVAPDLVLSSAKITGDAQFIAPSERRNARRIGSVVLADGTEITLLRLATPTSVPPAAISVVEMGDSLIATSAGQEWHGSARTKSGEAYSVEPDFTFGPGTAVYRDSDRNSLVGFAIHSGSGSVIVAARDVASHFAELNAGH
jgi:hypothetical protein